ncbi:hypothetical protein TWF696_000238 [Orbilia brochopaga]|uniref:Uncharacterized protein n=1 Tax=Orbilia brochopaga TaxID=3140254 RepID=A0AAV9VAN4_9PEZI
MLVLRIHSSALLLAVILLLNTVHASWWNDATSGVRCFFGDEDACDSSATPTPTPTPDRPEPTEAPTVPAERTKSEVIKTTDAPSSRPTPTTPARHTTSERAEETTSAEPTTSAVAITSAPTSTFTTETVAQTTSEPEPASATESSAPPSSSATDTAAAASNTSIGQALDSSSSPGPKVGIIAGGIVAGVLVFAALGVGASFIARRRWRAKDAEMARQRAEQMNFGKVESRSTV